MNNLILNCRSVASIDYRSYIPSKEEAKGYLFVLGYAGATYAFSKVAVEVLYRANGYAPLIVNISVISFLIFGSYNKYMINKTLLQETRDLNSSFEETLGSLNSEINGLQIENETLKTLRARRNEVLANECYSLVAKKCELQRLIKENKMVVENLHMVASELAEEVKKLNEQIKMLER